MNFNSSSMSALALAGECHIRFMEVFIHSTVPSSSRLLVFSRLYLDARPINNILKVYTIYVYNDLKVVNLSSTRYLNNNFCWYETVAQLYLSIISNEAYEQQQQRLSSIFFSNRAYEVRREYGATY